MGTIVTNLNSIHEGINSRLKSGNACCHSVKNLLFSSLLYKSINTKIYRTIALPVVLYGCETWPHTLSFHFILSHFAWEGIHLLSLFVVNSTPALSLEQC